ncbi:MAG: hypothetical protein QXL15_00760 [Candidatus Korarchaeota archaeon]
MELSPEEIIIEEFKKGRTIREIIRNQKLPLTLSAASEVLRAYLGYLYVSGHDITAISKMTGHSKSVISLHLKKCGVFQCYSRWGKIPTHRPRMTSVPKKFFKFTPKGAKWLQEGDKILVEFHPSLVRGDYRVLGEKTFFLYIPPIVPNTARYRRWHLLESKSNNALLEFQYK